MLKNHVFRLRNVQIWAVPTCKDFDLLMLRNRVFGLGYVHIWVVPSCKGVDFLMLRNHVYRLPNVNWQCRLARGSNFKCSGFAFSGCETFQYGNAVL